MTIDLKSLSLDELEVLADDLSTELSARREAEQMPEVIDDMLRKKREIEGSERGDEWVAPEGVHDAFPLGWMVTHKGSEWVSLVHGNVWEPGVSGWREIVAEDEAPALWVQPTGAHDAYQKGDRVTYDEAVWISIADNNVWSPGIYGWEKEKA